MLSNILATKLHRPTPPARRVQRPHLVRRLNEGLAAGRRLTLVSAPAGFGKTTCVSEWLNSAGLPVAWLSLELADDDPARLWSYLLAALQGVDRSIGREMTGSLQAAQVLAVASLTTLLNDILALGRKFVLVLDDFHVLREGAILDVFERLIAGQPDNMHLVLVTREDPLLPLARLRANNQMTEIRAADLRFSSSEAGHLLNDLMDLSLSEADVAALQNRTEGWVAGLQLAGLSVRGRSDPSSFIAGLSGSHRYILSYLTEEVLDRQPDETRDFLLQTSVLDKLSGELCDAVTGRTDSGDLLERLFAANLFLIPLTDDHWWYRYHHLFAHLLATRLRQSLSAAEIERLHCRAGDWLAQNDLPDEAIRHALAGKNYEGAVALVDHVALEMIFAGRLNILRGWLETLPAASFAANPRLGVYRAWIDLLQGRSDLSTQAIQARQDLLSALPPSPENDRLRLELMLVLCRYLPLQGNAAGSIRLAQEALGRLSEGDVAGRARVAFALAVAYSLDADTDNAELASRQCVRLAQAAGDHGLIAEMVALMAQGSYHHGQLHEAARLYQSVVDLGVASGEPAPTAVCAPLCEVGQVHPFYPAGHGHIGLASVYLERDELDAAQCHLEQGIELCSRGGLDGVYRGYYIRSRLRQAKGDLEGALADVDLLDQAFPREDDPLKVTRRALILRAMGDITGLTRCALPWLTMLSPIASGADPATARPPTVILEVIEALAARVLLAQGEIDRATQALDELQATAEPGGRSGLLIEVCLLRALVLQRQRDALACSAEGVASAALAWLERALDLAEPEGYVLLFLEEGPALIPLLQAAADDGAAPDRLKDYARRLLAAFAKHAAHESANSPVPVLPVHANIVGPAGSATPSTVADQAAVAEPLTGRELEILRLIAEGCTNQEIAGRLVITLHTVKKHSSNIFGKLGVNSRTQAIAWARKSGLL